MDPPTREILDWVSAYLVSNPRLDRLFANFAQCEDVELLSENAQREWGNRMTFNVLNSYEEQGLLGDWTAPPSDAPVNDPGDLCSWDILEGRACAMPQSWDSGHKSDLFNLCLELRIQSVLCCHQSGRDLDEAQWKRAVARAFTPLGGGCRDTRAKNKVLRDKKLLLEKYGKPEHRQALKQFAVNHSLEDAKKRLHAMLPELAKAFPKPFLQQVFDDMRSGAYRPGARVDDGGMQPQLQPRPNKAESISGAPDGKTAVASPAIVPLQQRLRPGGTATLRVNDTSGGSSMGAAALPARNFSLEELSSGNEASFVQIWERKHPEVHAWLKVSQPQSQPQRRDAPTRPCGTRSAAIADEHRHESSSASNSRHDGAASTQHVRALAMFEMTRVLLAWCAGVGRCPPVDFSCAPACVMYPQLHELRDHSDRLKQVGGRDPLQETLSALQNGGSNCASGPLPGNAVPCILSGNFQA
jgi:hypothetical protein